MQMGAECSSFKLRNVEAELKNINVAITFSAKVGSLWAGNITLRATTTIDIGIQIVVIVSSNRWHLFARSQSLQVV
jgi:hypothetical protein